MIELSAVEAERALRKATEEDLKFWKFQAWKIGIVCLAIGAVIGTIANYIFLKG